MHLLKGILHKIVRAEGARKNCSFQVYFRGFIREMRAEGARKKLVLFKCISVGFIRKYAPKARKKNGLEMTKVAFF